MERISIVDGNTVYEPVIRFEPGRCAGLYSTGLGRYIWVQARDGTLAQENTALLRSVPPPALAYPPFIVPGSGVDVFDQYRWKEAIFVGPTRHSRYLPSALVCCDLSFVCVEPAAFRQRTKCIMQITIGRSMGCNEPVNQMPQWSLAAPDRLAYQLAHDWDDKQRATIRTWYHGVKPNKLFDANNQSSLPWSCVVRPGINIGSCSMQVIAARAHDLAMRDLHGANVRSSDLNMSDDTWALVVERLGLTAGFEPAYDTSMHHYIYDMLNPMSQVQTESEEQQQASGAEQAAATSTPECTAGISTWKWWGDTEQLMNNLDMVIGFPAYLQHYRRQLLVQEHQMQKICFGAFSAHSMQQEGSLGCGGTSASASMSGSLGNRLSGRPVASSSSMYKEPAAHDDSHMTGQVSRSTAGQSLVAHASGSQCDGPGRSGCSRPDDYAKSPSPVKLLRARQYQRKSRPSAPAPAI